MCVHVVCVCMRVCVCVCVCVHGALLICLHVRKYIIVSLAGSIPGLRTCQKVQSALKLSGLVGVTQV